MCDYTVVSAYEDIRYLSGFSSGDAYLIIGGGKKLLLTDSRYETQAALEAREFEVVICEKSLDETLINTLSELKPSSVGYQTKALSDYTARALRKNSDIEWIPMESYMERERAIKTDAEAENIKRAAQIADAALSELLGELRAGMTERQIAARLDYLMQTHGSEEVAFKTIALCGKNTALPHGSPSDTRLLSDDILLVDFGATYRGYRSDITRTVIVGKPDKEILRIRDIVYGVQRECVGAVRAGVKCSELDALSRRIFAQNGMTNYIKHSLGHGVGLAIHEQPVVSLRSAQTLQAGMVITIEPGLYMEDLCGVRTEDTLLVTESGALSLTQAEHLINI